MAKAASDSYEEHRKNTPAFSRPNHPQAASFTERSQAPLMTPAERLNKLSVDESFGMIDGLRLAKGGKQ